MPTVPQADKSERQASGEHFVKRAVAGTSQRHINVSETQVHVENKSLDVIE